MSAPAAVVPVVPLLLTGHSAPILSLTLDSRHTRLASGSEDGGMRIWSNQSKRCIRGCKIEGEEKEITALKFHDEYGNADAAKQPHHQPPPAPSHDRIYAACATGALIGFDLRASNEIILRRPASEWRHNTEEINTIQLQRPQTHAGRARFMATADDNGEVKIISLEEKKEGQLFKTLKGTHTSLCSCVLFRPGTGWEVWTGGMDCLVVCWDFSNGRPIKTFSTQPTNNNTSSTQTLNPPFVNAMAFTADGRYLLVASGNAELIVYDAVKRIEVRRVTGHTHSLMHVSISPVPKFAASSFRGAECVITGGNDQTILLWDLQELLTPTTTTTQQAATSVSASTAKNRLKKAKARARKKAAGGASSSSSSLKDDDDDDVDADVSAGVGSLSLSSFTGAPIPSTTLPPSIGFTEIESSALDTPCIRHRWRHPAKMNAIVAATHTSTDVDNNQPTIDAITIYVADTTNNITAYELR